MIGESHDLNRMLSRPGGGIGRRKGLKIPRHLVLYRFDSGPGHHKKRLALMGQPFLVSTTFIKLLILGKMQ